MSDRYLYVALPIFLAASFFTVRYALTDIIELTELQPIQKAPEPKKAKPEDSINLATLLTLSRSPNPNIAKSAIQLVIERYADLPDVHKTLREERFSTDEGVRRQCKATIDFLLAWPNTPEPLMGCVRALRTPKPWEDVVEEAREYPEWVDRQEILPETPPTFYEGGSGDHSDGLMLNFGTVGDGPSDDMDEDDRRRLRRETFVVGAEELRRYDMA
ncbi:hypothetical protein LTR97_008025 [Elasticomyces elasticus]|uniref:Uncharacterized protein n=1 Tax=Elasticomyces elasticus TaxID=574655 RepID=A0AAN7W7W5_9PEZI|nr:hypothetical protein LTR97_008025 [Elasticomyces elasticus]